MKKVEGFTEEEKLQMIWNTYDLLCQIKDLQAQPPEWWMDEQAEVKKLMYEELHTGLAELYAMYPSLIHITGLTYKQRSCDQ